MTKQAQTLAGRNDSSILTKIKRYFPFVIFRRLNAMFTALCVQKVVHAFCSDETSPDTRNHSPILTKIKRNFYTGCDISTFKRYVLRIMRAESRARVFQRRNRPRHAQIAIIRRF